MPTKAPKGWYEPEISKAKVNQIIDLTAPIAKEVVNYGLSLLARSSATARGGDGHLALFALYHHVLDMVDSAQVLIAECAGSGVALPLRSAFEALVSLEYIDAGFPERAFAWLVGDVHRKWQFYLSLDERTSNGKRTRQLLAEDRDAKELASDTVVPTPQALDAQYDRFKRLLKKPGWKETEQKWRDLKAKRKRRPQWHELDGGPSSFQGLAEAVKRGYSYHLLYREWSVKMHAAAVLDHFRLSKSKELGIVPLRDGSQLAGQALLAISFGLAAHHVILRRYRGEEGRSYAMWYAQEIRAKYLTLGGLSAVPPRRVTN